MNTLHLKYAVAISETGSLRGASEKLLIAPSNLSRSIRDLEKDLGIRIFVRTRNGMKLTPEGDNLLRNARTVLSQIDELEEYYQNKYAPKQSFSISVPGAGYIAAAFAEFSQRPDCRDAGIHYAESNSYGAIDNLLSRRCDLGIIRTASEYNRYFLPMFERNGIDYKVISRFRYVSLISRESALAKLPEVYHSDLSKFTEIAYADPYVPTLPIDTVRKNENTTVSRKRVFVYERSDSLGLLRMNRNAYMWVSPVPKKQLDYYALCQKPCPDNTRQYSDVLIFRKNYKFSRLDEIFIEELYKTAGECGLE